MALTKIFRTLLISVVFLSTSVISAEAGDNSPFYHLLNNEKTLSLFDISQIDLPASRIALYQMDDRSSTLINKSTNAVIESKIAERFINSTRYSLVSCIECKTTKVSLIGDKLKISQPIETNADLKVLGEKLGVDAFLFWQATSFNNEEHLNVKLVAAQDDRVIWAKQYSHFHVAERSTFEEEFYIGIISIDAKRVDSVTNNTISLDSLSTFGYRPNPQIENRFEVKSF